MLQIGSKVWETGVTQSVDGIWSFRCEDTVQDIIGAFDGAVTAVITRLGTATTYFDPQLLSISQDFQKNQTTVMFSVKSIPGDVASELLRSIEDAYDGLVDMGEYAASLDERIAALEGENDG